jgi:hypothetical protein
MATDEPTTVHYTELAPAQPGTLLAVEWETSRREVGRLLTEGHEGKHGLLKDKTILGVFDTRATAMIDALKRGYQLSEILIRQIQIREKLIRVPWWYWLGRTIAPPRAVHQCILPP